MKFLLYTEDEGGEFKFIAFSSEKATISLYKKTIKSRVLQYQDGDRITKIRPAYITLCESVEGFDFINKEERTI